MILQLYSNVISYSGLLGGAVAAVRRKGCGRVWEDEVRERAIGLNE